MIKHKDLYLSVLSYIYEEIYPDKLALLNLVLKYSISQQYCKQQLVANVSKKKQLKFFINYSNVQFKEGNNRTESVFHSTIQSYFMKFSAIIQALLLRQNANQLVRVCKEKFLVHYNCISIMLEYDNKIRLWKSRYLKDTLYYD